MALKKVAKKEKINPKEALRKSMSATYGAMPYPWGVVTDPLTNKPKIVPPEGHYAGVCARIINNRGVHKAPAGTEATLRGFIAMEKTLSKADCEVLNPVGVICLLTRRNYGLVVWGARGLNSADTTMRYVSDHFLNIHIRKSLYEGTQFAVFEPNDATLWASLRITCKQFMEELKTKSAAELNEDLVAAKKELFNLRFQNATNQLDNTSRIKEVKKHIARIQTVLASQN